MKGRYGSVGLSPRPPRRTKKCTSKYCKSTKVHGPLVPPTQSVHGPASHRPRRLPLRNPSTHYATKSPTTHHNTPSQWPMSFSSASCFSPPFSPSSASSPPTSHGLHRGPQAPDLGSFSRTPSPFLASSVSYSGRATSSASSIPVLSISETTHKEKTSPSLCSICLEVVRDRATPNKCRHAFCFPCIASWAKIINDCPLCKTRFTYLLHHGDDGQVSETVAVKERKHPIFHSNAYQISQVTGKYHSE